MSEFDLPSGWPVSRLLELFNEDGQYLMSIDANTRSRIIDALKLGMPIGNVADYVKVDLEVVRLEMTADPEFRMAVNHAIAECMHARLEALEKLQNWQALAFMLESLWPKRFGRKTRGRLKHRKPTRAENRADFSRISEEERQQLDYLLGKVHGRDGLEADNADLPGERPVKPEILPDGGVAGD